MSLDRPATLASDLEVRLLARRWRDNHERVVLVSGSFDVLHVGHVRFFAAARLYGNRLIVGVDCDQKILARKGSMRPFNTENVRAEMVSHVRYVDAVSIKRSMERWHFIRNVHPDIVVTTENLYSNSDLEKLRLECEKVVVLPRQATISSSQFWGIRDCGPVDDLESC